MTTISDGTIQLFTFKDGLLSRLGHDLRLRVGSFEITLDGSAVDAWFDADSIEVEGAMSGQRMDPAGVSDKDKAEIRKSMRDKVLRVKRYPRVSFNGTAERSEGQVRVEGRLSLVGREQPLSVQATRQDGRLRGTLTLLPSRWGITPFKALLGALRLQDRVEVSFDLADPE